MLRSPGLGREETKCHTDHKEVAEADGEHKVPLPEIHHSSSDASVFDQSSPSDDFTDLTHPPKSILSTLPLESLEKVRTYLTGKLFI